MPLRKISKEHKNQQFTVVFGTLGPYGLADDKTQIQRDVREICVKNIGQNRIKNLITTAEFGKEGYRHCHVGIEMHSSKVRVSKLAKELRYLVSTWKRDEDEWRKPACSFYYVPTPPPKGKKYYDVILDYVKNPVKEKEIGEYIEFEERDKWWVVDGKITDFRAACFDMMCIDYKLSRVEQAIETWHNMDEQQRLEANIAYNQSCRDRFKRSHIAYLSSVRTTSCCS